jgi:hypothetical protein
VQHAEGRILDTTSTFLIAVTHNKIDVKLCYQNRKEEKHLNYLLARKANMNTMHVCIFAEF